MPSSVTEGLIRGINNAVSTIMQSIKGPLQKLGNKTLYPILAALGVFEVTQGVGEVFKASKTNAKLAGILLGCTLALRDPFPS